MAKFNELVAGEMPVLVDFYAEWCGPCKTMGPILHQVKDELKEGVRIIKIDTDRNPSLSNKFQVRSVPTLMLFQKGEMKWRQSGIVQARDIVRLVEQHSKN